MKLIIDKLLDFLLNIWWSIWYYNSGTTKERHNGVTVTAKGSGERARGKK